MILQCPSHEPGRAPDLDGTFSKECASARHGRLETQGGRGVLRASFGAPASSGTRGVFRFLALVFVALGLSWMTSLGATVSWVGPTTGAHLWSAPSNWQNGRVPGPNDDVRIDGEGLNLVVQFIGSATVRSLDSSCTLRIVSDIGNNSHLTASEFIRNRGSLRIEGPRSDRTSSLSVTGTAGLENLGTLTVIAEGGGGRRINGGVVNRGVFRVEAGIELTINNRDRLFEAAAGRIDAQGTLGIEEGRVTVSGGQWSGDIRAFNATTTVAATASAPGTLRLLGFGSVLAGNASSAFTLHLDTDIGNNTTLTTRTGAVNEGRILLGSSRIDRTCRLEVGAGFTNRSGGVIEVLRGEGGDRTINGALINQGLLSSSETVTLFTGTYQADGGRAVGDVRFVNARIIPTRSTAGPTELQLFGSGSVLAGGNPTNLILRVISDVGAQASLTIPSNMVNRGTIRLESLRSDRTTTLNASAVTVENRGLIQIVSTNAGGRVFRGSLVNYGRVLVDTGIHLEVANRAAVMSLESGSLEVRGSLGIVEGRVNVNGGTASGDIRIYNGSTLVAPTMSSPATLRLLGTASSLLGNASPAVTLYLETDVGNPTTLTTGPGAMNVGRIVMGSARSDRVSRLEVSAGFTNAPSGVIDVVRDGGGERQIHGTLVNQGLILATNMPVLVTGTYQADGGTVEGDVIFFNARILPTRSTPEPTELQLFGAASVLAGDNLENLILRVISDIGANAVLLFNTNLINRGIIRLESLRSDRTTVLRGEDGLLVNGETGVIITDPANAGGRRIGSALRNRGRLVLGYPLEVSLGGAQHRNEGRIELAGQTLTVAGATFVNAQGGRIVGSGAIDASAVAFSNAGLLTPGTSPGRVTLTGNYTHATTGILDVEVASGAGPGTGHDILEINNGSATIEGGTLSTRLLGDFVPNAEVRFRVLSATRGVTGRFARTPNLQVHPNRYFQPEYLPNALDLRTLAGVNTALPPSIVVQPASQEVELQGAALFAVSVNGSGPFTFQWRRNGQPIPGATSSTLSLARVLAGDLGEYDVVVSNAAGSSTSETARLNQKTTSTGENTKDFGDAPDLPYPTTLAHNGAAQVVRQGFSLGAAVDADDGTLQNVAATADGADEDGVIFLDPLIPGNTVTIRVAHARPAGHRPGRLSAWIDWGQNNTWAEFGDWIIRDRPLVQGNNDFAVTVPANAVVGLTYARFRLFVDIDEGYAGDSPEDGEVEDYRVEITRTGGGGGGGGGEGNATEDFGDAPDNFRTLLSSNGARHVRIPGLSLGQVIDLETNGAPHVLAIGDDIAGQPDDEDGVTGSPFFVPGATVELSVTVVGTGKVDAWFDFDRNNNYGEPADWVLVGEPFSTETRTFKIAVPQNATPGESYARFRLTRQGIATWFGPAPDGEVEDYVFLIVSPPKDWGDAPARYPTTEAKDGARHTVVDGFHLGKSQDAENDGQPNANATGDDVVPAGDADDEDGVVFTTSLIPGQQAEVRVEASQDGRLDAWIDFGDDGDWAELGDRIFTGKRLQAGLNTLVFDVPSTAVSGPTFARFRLSRFGLNTYTGEGLDGEVEDYRVVIEDDSGCELGCTGRDFWFTFPGMYAPDPGNPMTPRLRVTGANGTVVTVSIPGLNSNLVATITGSVTTFTLPRAVDLGSLNDGVLNRGIHVTSTAPVGVQAISQADHTSDGFLALPTEVLTGEYVVAAFPNTQVGVPEISGSQFAIVATEANTSVVITPKVETGLRIAGVPYTIVLTNSGDCYQLRNTNDAPADLTGTVIQADRPVAVVGGHVCANVNSGNLFFCDYLVEQMLPVERMASEFFTAPLANRTGGETVRVVAARDNTVVTVNGAATTLAHRGDVFETLLTEPGHILSTQPVLVNQFASSSDQDGVLNSDPFMVTIPGRPHFTSSHTFATGGTNFQSHHVTVVAPTSVTSLTLDGTVTNVTFTDISGSGFRYARLGVSQGAHTLSASANVGVIVYGWSEYMSYGWPACLFFGDTTPPHLTCLTNSVTVRIGQFGNDVPCKTQVPNLRPWVNFDDNCGVSLDAPITQEPAPGTLVGVGSHEVTLSVTDNRGNVGRCVITLIVVDPTVNPTVSLTCPDDITVRCENDTGAVVNYSVEALRGCTPIAVTCTPPSGSRFPVGTTEVTCRISEPGVPVQQCTFKVTVNCSKKREVKISPVRRVPPTPELPDPPAEIVVEWDQETGTILEVAERLEGPWTQVPNAAGRHVIKILKESGKFFRLRAPR